MTELTLDVHTSPMVDLPNGGQFSPTTSTLVLGDTEAALIDTQYLPADIEQVIARIEQSGRRLTTIFVTHGHFDHYFGLETLLARFGDAEAVATAAVAADIEQNLEAHRAHVKGFVHPGTAVDNTVVPRALAGNSFTVDGASIDVIELPQADIAPTAAAHIPSIGAVVAGDAVYHGINPFLASSTSAQWPKWVQSVDILAALRPKIVVAGHKQPGMPDDPNALDFTRDYLTTFIKAVEEQPDTRSLVAHMQSAFGELGNPSALLASAATAMKANRA